MPRGRTRSQNCAQINRAKRAEELDLRDTVLRVADDGLIQAQAALAKAALAATCRPEDAAKRISEAQDTIKVLRQMLLGYYDIEDRPDLNGKVRQGTLREVPTRAPWWSDGRHVVIEDE